MMILNKLFELAGSNPGGTFVVTDSGPMTYGKALAGAREMAARLLSAGFSPRCVVGLRVSGDANFIRYFFGALIAGVVPVIIGKRADEAEISRIAAMSSITSIVTDSAFDGQASGAHGASAFSVNAPERDLTVFCPDTDAGLQIERPCPVLDASDDTAFMLVTSGTGGKMKIVRKSASAMDHQTVSLMPLIPAAAEGFSPKFFVNVPLSHSYGLEFALFGALHNGVPLRVAGFGFSESVFDEIASSMATHVFTVPPFIMNLASYKLSKGAEFPALSMVTSAGMRLAPSISKNFERAFGFGVSSVYGITELGCVCFRRLSREAGESDCENDVGYPLAGNAIEVLDDSGAPVPPGAVGRIFLKKTVPDGGYFGETPEGAEGKWTEGLTRFETDDSGYLDASGALHVLGRSASYINVGGEKINAFDVENFLRESRLFSEVLVWGAPDPLLGQRIVAAVVPSPAGSGATSDSVRELCKASLPLIKVPRQVWVFETPLPKTATGKIRFDEVVRMCGEREQE